MKNQAWIEASWIEKFRVEFGSYECLHEKRKSKKGDWTLIEDIEKFIKDLLSSELQAVLGEEMKIPQYVSDGNGGEIYKHIGYNAHREECLKRMRERGY